MHLVCPLGPVCGHNEEANKCDMKDSELLRNYASTGSNEAFSALVAEYVGLVHSTALRKVEDPHLAEEVAQAVFVILAQKAGSLSRKTVLSGWLYRTTLFAASHAVRAENRRRHREQKAFEMESLPPDPPSNSVWAEIVPHLDEAMASLGEKDRNAILLRFFHNQDIKETAAATGQSVEATKKRIARAVEKLRRFFVRRGVFLNAVAVTSALSGSGAQAAPAGFAISITSAVAGQSAAAATSITLLANQTMKTLFWIKCKTVGSAALATLTALGTAALLANEAQKKAEADALRARVLQAYQNTVTYLATTRVSTVDRATGEAQEGHTFVVAFDRANDRFLEQGQAPAGSNMRSSLAVLKDGKFFYRNNVTADRANDRRHLEASVQRPLNWREAYLVGPSIDNLLAGGLLALFTGGGLVNQEREKFDLGGDANFSLVSPGRTDPPNRIGLKMSRPGSAADATIVWIDPTTHLITQAVREGNDSSMVWDVAIRIHNEPLGEELFAFDTAGSKGVATERELSGRDPRPLLGREAPPFRLPALDGGAFDLSRHHDEVVVLFFTATWCGPCKASVPQYQKVHEWGQNNGIPLAIRAIDVKEPAELVRREWKTLGLTIPVLLDESGEVAERYKVDGYPTSVVIHQGRVRYRGIPTAGELRLAVEYLLQK